MALIVLLVRALIAGVQMLPLDAAARLGRALGWVAWHADRRHRKVAILNLTAAFGAEKNAAELKAIARENFLRIGECYACGLKTASMTGAAMGKRLEWVDLLDALPKDNGSVVGAVGHFGNFELFARIKDIAPQWSTGTTYRALRQPQLNRLFQTVREATGAYYFERRTEGAALKAAMAKGRIVLGLLADQHAGDRGAWLPFLGRPCSCSTAPALFALRYQTPLYTAICYRIKLAHWRIEVGERIPTHDTSGAARSVEEITLDINKAFEKAIRRDPANWFWVHRRWKPMSPIQKARLEAAQRGAPAAAEEDL